MFFNIMWKDIRVAVLYGTEKDVKYKIFFENLPKAKADGLIINPILQHTTDGTLPNWINNRIPQNAINKLKYLKESEGRLETDHIWFQSIE